MKQEARTVYEQTKEEAIPYIEAWHNDLSMHDRRTIEENPGVPFLHFTGTTGTYLVLLPEAMTYPARGKLVPYLFGQAGRQHLLNQVVTVTDRMGKVNRDKLTLYYDGAKVRGITLQRASQIARDYRDRIKRQWAQEE